MPQEMVPVAMGAITAMAAAISQLSTISIALLIPPLISHL